MNAGKGTLEEMEPHPSAEMARLWIVHFLGNMSSHDISLLLESLASTALSGNRMAEVCGETLRRLIHREPVSDRYLLGLAWFLRSLG